ncbi:MAG: hypothetical protein DDT26_02361 [Dehalococcoidia bacterium]|nr:hypothetical protein [Chloroflexota bacterium]
MEDWLATPGRGRFVYARTRANVIFDHIIRHAMIEFDGDGEATVKALSEPQSVKFLFHGTVVARFKKGNARGVGSNIETQAVLAFIDPQGSFEGFPAIHRVEIVYQLNLLGTGYAEVSVVARDKRMRIWAYPLTGKPSADIVPLPIRKPPTLTPPVVMPKPSSDEKSDDQKPTE